jgi:hypothetical protein
MRFNYDYQKREKSTSQIFYDINTIGKLIPAYSWFIVMQVLWNP